MIYDRRDRGERLVFDNDESACLFQADRILAQAVIAVHGDVVIRSDDKQAELYGLVYDAAMALGELADAMRDRKLA